MSENLQSNQVLLSTLMGLNRIYVNLESDGVAGISKDELNKMTSKLTSSDLPFAKMLRTNFSILDKNKDGILSADEYKKMITSLQVSGFSYSQLISLSAQGALGTSSTLMDTVLANFNEVDKNHDGRVSIAEMNSYATTKESDESQSKLLSNLLKEDYTVFYGNDVSSSSKLTDSTYDADDLDF